MILIEDIHFESPALSIRHFYNTVVSNQHNFMIGSFGKSFLKQSSFHYENSKFLGPISGDDRKIKDAKMALTLNINGEDHVVDADSQMPLLWAIREKAGLTGTKFGCGIAQCGACTVIIDGNAVRSCNMPVAAAVGKSIRTVEGVSADNDHPVQQAWQEITVPQCGYCQSGQIMSAVALLEKNDAPSDNEIDKAMAGNICRCGTYPRIRAAIHRAAEIAKS